MRGGGSSGGGGSGGGGGGDDWVTVSTQRRNRLQHIGALAYAAAAASVRILGHCLGVGREGVTLVSESSRKCDNGQLATQSSRESYPIP